MQNKAMGRICVLFVNVQNPDALFRKVGECEGAVSYLDGQGARRDFKPVAAQMLTYGAPLRPREIPALEVLAENPNDQARLMRCMMDAHC